MKRILLLVYIIFSTFLLCSAQKEKNIWYFGYQAGLDFSSGQPVALTNSGMTTSEAAAVMNDSAGKLLFYTNGEAVWNAQHDTMDNGAGLMGCNSTTQTLIVPKPGIEDSLYYIFTADCYENYWMLGIENGLRYNIVDMKKNSGLGKVILKNIFLHDTVTEKITAITHANGHDFWVLAHERNNNNFIEYLITCRGLDTIPKIISVGQSLSTGYSMIGCLKSSSNGQKLAMAAGMIFELYDFNTLNGDITNCLNFTNDSMGAGALRYGVAFSPDNTKLYLNRSGYPGSCLWQYDLSAGSPVDIISSKVTLFRDTTNQIIFNFGPLGTAIDGKIYQSHYTLGNGMGDTLLGVINYPNLQGTACLYTHDGFDLKGGKSNISLTNFIETPYNYINCTEGFNEIKIDNYINIYPNPCSEYFNIETKKENLINVELFDLLGKVIDVNAILNEDNKEKKLLIIDCSKIPNGCYILKILSVNKYYFNKLIKNN